MRSQVCHEVRSRGLGDAITERRNSFAEGKSGPAELDDDVDACQGQALASHRHTAPNLPR